MARLAVAIGDVNGDGKPDLATANYDGGTVSVLANKGDGSFQAKIDHADPGASFRSVAIGDLNGDRRPDLATANGETDDVIRFRQHDRRLQGAERQEEGTAGREAGARLEAIAASARSAAPTRRASRRAV